MLPVSSQALLCMLYPYPGTSVLYILLRMYLLPVSGIGLIGDGDYKFLHVLIMEDKVHYFYQH